jgi:hypothetical protein
LTDLVVSIPLTCAAHRNLCDFINLTIFSFLIWVSNSSFFLSSVFHHYLVLLNYSQPRIEF